MSERPDWVDKKIADALKFQSLNFQRTDLLSRLKDSPIFQELVGVEKQISQLTEPSIPSLNDTEKDRCGNWHVSRHNCRKCAGQATVVRRVEFGCLGTYLFEGCTECDYVGVGGWSAG